MANIKPTMCKIGSEPNDNRRFSVPHYTLFYVLNDCIGHQLFITVSPSNLSRTITFYSNGLPFKDVPAASNVKYLFLIKSKFTPSTLVTASRTTLQ